MKMFEHYRKTEIFSMLLMWIVTIGVGIYIAVMYQKIPDVIPTHLDYGDSRTAGEAKQAFSFSTE